MVDRNNNGIDDSREAGAMTSAYGIPMKRAQENKAPTDPFSWLNNMLKTPIREGLNFAGQALRSPWAATGALNPGDGFGTGVGDQIFGVDPGYYQARAQGGQAPSTARQIFGENDNTPVSALMQGSTGDALGGIFQMADGVRNFVPQQTPQQDQVVESMGLGDAMRQAMEVLNQYGFGNSGVDYDPVREALEQRYGQADSRTAALYSALQNSIQGQEGAVKQDYGQAIDSQTARTADTQGQVQGAYSDAVTGLDERAQALGIQEAVANSIREGNDLSRDQAAATAETAQRGEIASNQLSQNQGAAVDFNRGMAQTAGLTGTNTRNARLSEYLNGMADIDMQEAQQNSGLQAQQIQTALGLANQILGRSDDQQKYQDTLAQQAMEMAMQGQGGGNEQQSGAYFDAALQDMMKFYGQGEEGYSVNLQDENQSDIFLELLKARARQQGLYSG